MGKCALYLGTPTAPVLVLAEKNGQAEATLGEPFASRVTRGELARNLTKAGLHPWDDVRATNLVLCGIPDPRPPSQQEIKNCQWWFQLIELYPPRLIIALGQVVIDHLKPSDLPSRSVTDWNGVSFTWQHIPVVCSYNPAYLIRIRDTNPDLYRQAVAVWRGPVRTAVNAIRTPTNGARR